MKVKVGVFDSGIGGKSVAHAIERALPDVAVVFKNDSENVPYGLKTPDELKQLVLPIMQSLVDEGCAVIVVACNTVSTTIIDWLRQQITVPFVSLVPMVKPAAMLTKSKIIAVCATPTTLASQRYAELKQEFAQGIQVLEPDCSDWTTMIEAHAVDREKIHERIDGVCQAGADVIVLGCTHYHWIEEMINEIAAGRATVIQPEQAIIAQLKRVLAQLA